MNILHSNRELFVLLIGVIFGIMIMLAIQNPFQEVSSIVTPFDEFPEAPWRTEATLDAKVVVSTKFSRCEVHKVKTESGAIVNDWIWTDERTHVNILVHLKDDDKYLLFKQRKYGLEKEYFAVIGGLCEVGEDALDTAKRELLEETGLEAEEWVNLGRYRVQVNRGGGILFAYLARNSVLSKDKKPSDDYEKQKPVKVTRHELMEIALNGEVGEAQWVSAVALGKQIEIPLISY